EAASQMLRQKRLHDGGERAAVFRSSESMTLVGIDNVGDRNAALLHCRYDLLGFGCLDPYVVGALTDEKRTHDAADVIERRSVLQELLPLIGGVVAHPRLPQ